MTPVDSQKGSDNGNIFPGVSIRPQRWRPGKVRLRRMPGVLHAPSLPDRHLRGWFPNSRHRPLEGSWRRRLLGPGSASDSVGLGWGQRGCISSGPQRAAATVGRGPCLQSHSPRPLSGFACRLPRTGIGGNRKARRKAAAAAPAAGRRALACRLRSRLSIRAAVPRVAQAPRTLARGDVARMCRRKRQVPVRPVRWKDRDCLWPCQPLRTSAQPKSAGSA